MADKKANDIERVVILGVSGFIGNALARFYEKQDVEICGFSSNEINLLSAGELNKLEGLVDRKTALVVASAVTREKGDTFEVFQANLSMIANVARFLENHPVGECVYYSSIAVYGDPETNLAVNEKTAVQPESYYALAKYAGEFVLGEAARRAGFPLLVLRASRVYGPGDTHATYGPMKFIRTIFEEEKVYLFGEGEDLRDHLYIEDLVKLTERLISGNFTGTLNLVTGKSRPFLELVEILREISPVEFKIVHLARTPPLTHQQFDIQKLSEAVPNFQFTGLRRGLQETVKAFPARNQKTTSFSRRGL